MLLPTIDMLEENKCEHPINAWFGCCDLYNKDGTYRGSGIGRKIARVTWYHLYDQEKTEYTYDLCEDCLNQELLEGCDGEANRELHGKGIEYIFGEKDYGLINQITEVHYYDGRESLYPYAKITLI